MHWILKVEEGSTGFNATQKYIGCGANRMCSCVTCGPNRMCLSETRGANKMCSCETLRLSLPLRLLPLRSLQWDRYLWDRYPRDRYLRDRYLRDRKPLRSSPSQIVTFKKSWYPIHLQCYAVVSQCVAHNVCKCIETHSNLHSTFKIWIHWYVLTLICNNIALWGSCNGNLDIGLFHF